MNTILNDFLNVIFPAYCPVCGCVLYEPDAVICLACELGMPRTGYSTDPENPVAQIFWGRAEIASATSLFRFEKGSAYQPLLHQFKYKGIRKIGRYLGRLLGNDLKNTAYADCDVMVPVPLHPRKMRQRGFNQSEIICRGVKDILDIPVRTDILKRSRYTATQTKKGRYERTVNMDGVFRLHEQFCTDEQLSILLVDDVVTTGSTIEACANILLETGMIRVWVATVACA